MEREEKAIPTPITPSNTEKVFDKGDIDKILEGISSGYSTLAALIVSRLETLEILRPVVDENLFKSVETKAHGLSINLLKLEKDLMDLKANSEEIDKLIMEKDLTATEDAKNKVDLELLPKFELFIYNSGTLSKNIESLSEYYFSNIQAVVDSLESNTYKKHSELAKTIKIAKERDESKETVILGEK